MPPHIKIHWIGYRKNSSRGAIWAWFTEADKQDHPVEPYYKSTRPAVYCHVAWGSIGKKLQFETYELTNEFLYEAKSLSHNYREMEPERITSRWGKSFDEDLSQYLLLLKLKG